MRKLPHVLFSAGICLLIASWITGWYIVPFVIKSMIESEMTIKNGTPLWDIWIKPAEKVPIYFKVYIFNVTNPDEIEEGGDPVVKEIGPYVYQEKRRKRIIEENEDDNTVTYAEYYSYIFIEEFSNGREDDEVTVLNVPFVTAAQEVSKMSSFLRFVAISYIMRFKENTFVQRTVKEFLFTGTFVPLLNHIESLTGETYLPNNTFGMFYGKNNSETPVITVYTGINDPSKVGKIKSWNHNENLEFWNGPNCNMINGTDGINFSPFLTKTSPVHIFVPDLCRSFGLEYTGDANIEGIDGYRFKVPEKMFKHPTFNADNACYCTEDNWDKCPKSGVYSVKTCRYGAPIAVSAPHFFNADSAYSQKFGFHSSSSDDSYAVIEPTFTMNEEYAAVFHNLVTLPTRIAHSLKWILVALSLILIILSITAYFLQARKKYPSI